MQLLNKTLEDGSKIVSSISTVSIGNCGAQALTGFSASATLGRTEDRPWGGQYKKITKEDFFKELDAIDWKKHFPCGFYIITDNLNNQKKEKTDVNGYLRTNDFVDYLISRKLGVISRGITTVNPVYGVTGSIISSWSWAPNAATVISDDVTSWGTPANNASEEERTLKARALKYLKSQNEQHEDYQSGHTNVKRPRTKHKVVSV